MNLEIIENQTQKNSLPTLVFVHGAWMNAHCWNEFFLPYFEQKQMNYVALSLRNHGKSFGEKPLNEVRIKDYVTDLKNVVHQIKCPVVLVGHSMGGFVVQKYLEKYTVQKAVLLASAPPFSVFSVLIRSFFLSPICTLKSFLLQDGSQILKDQSLVRKTFYSRQFSPKEWQNYMQKLENESVFAVLDMLALDLVNTQKINTPLLVIGGKEDFIFPPEIQQKTAEIYKTKAIIFEKMSHNLFLEPQWQQIADQIFDWIRE